MKIGYFKLILYTAAFFGVFAWGVAVGSYKVFPFEQVRYVKNVFFPNNFTQAIKPRAQIFEFFSPNAQIVFVGDSITQGGIWAEFFPQGTSIFDLFRDDEASASACSVYWNWLTTGFLCQV